MNIVKLKLDQIEVPKDRLRTVHEGYAQEIASSMRLEGQLTPIEVLPPKKPGGKYRLNQGAHRRQAAEINGDEDIWAVIWEGPAKKARSREITENLIRRELSVLARAACIAEWQDLYPKSQHGGDRKSDQVAQSAIRSPRFTVYAADKIGLSETATRQLITIHKGLSAPVRKILENTPFEDQRSELLALAGIASPEEQLRIATAMVTEEKTFKQILGEPPVEAPVKEAQKQFDDFVRRFDKYNPEARRRVIHWLIEQRHITLGQVAA